MIALIRKWFTLWVIHAYTWGDGGWGDNNVILSILLVVAILYGPQPVCIRRLRHATWPTQAQIPVVASRHDKHDMLCESWLACCAVLIPTWRTTKKQ